MSQFKFRMAALLRIREATRDERRAALAEAYRVDDVLRRQLEQIAADLDVLRTLARQAAAPGVVHVDRLIEVQRYDVIARSHQAHVQGQRETVSAEIERRRQTLVEADREVRVLEKLRERQAEQHRQEEDRKETKRLDEVAVQQVLREAVP